MQTWIALFRGINVGGNNILPMAELREDLESIGLSEVRTYIQSGNVVFDSPTKSAPPLRKKIADAIVKRKGFRPQILLLTPIELHSAIEANPFPEAAVDPKTLHFFFLAETASNPSLDSIDAIKAASEHYRFINDVFYLHAPEGIGRSKLAAKVEKFLGVATTGRNFRTVMKIHALLDPDST